MQPQAYLTDIKARLVASAVVASIIIVEEYALPDRGYFRARLGLSNSDFLEVAEYFVVESGHCITSRYRHQWMDVSQEVLKTRWDNVEHFPDLPNFPHHTHVSVESRVEPGRSMSIIELIDVIEQELRDGTVKASEIFGKARDLGISDRTLKRAKKKLGGIRSEMPRRVLILTAEDGLADTVRPRLDALGAKPENVFAIEVPVTMDADGIAYLEKHIEQLKPSLVILDPLVAYMGEKVSLDKANQTRKVMASLAAVAEKHHCAIVTIRHLSKGTREKAIYRGLGSIDITAACRSVLMVGLDPEDDNRRIIAHAKCNLAQLGPSLSYTIG